MTSRAYVAFGIVLGAVIIVAAFYQYPRQEVAQTGVYFVIDGTVERLIAECPPSPNPAYTCNFFDLLVLRAVNGRTYLLRNLPEPSQSWTGKQVSITGNLVTPSASGFPFIQGDLYVLSIVSRT